MWGPLQLLHRLTWCREDLAAEGHGAEEDGEGSSGHLHDAEQTECGLECGTGCSLLPASFFSERPSPQLFIGSPDGWGNGIWE